METGNDGTIVEYKVLDTIEFTSARKRMSTVVRFPDGKLRLLIKGADMMIIDRLGADKKHLDVTQRHLDDFARTGLRTLCLATKEISEEYYKVHLRIWLEFQFSCKQFREMIGCLLSATGSLIHLLY